MKTLMDRKDSSHVGSTDYNAEITPQGGALATYQRKETESAGLLAAYMARIGKGGLLYAGGEHKAHERRRKILSKHPQGVACAYGPLYIEFCWDNWM
jgi:hypothetical protein